MFRIILAPNAFKGTLDPSEVCCILEQELVGDDIQVVSCPMGDGGDGTAKIIASYLQADPVVTSSFDALGRLHEITYYKTHSTAVIGLSDICGIKFLSSSEYDVMNANTAGVGFVLNQILQQGIKQVVLCIGGSASIDGGCGALVEMGMKIVKRSDKYSNHIIDCESIDTTILKEKFEGISFTVLCDVNNPLTGHTGAASVFGAQKGASPLQISILDSCLDRYARLIQTVSDKDVTNVKYGGAAGGIAASFHALLGARLVSGAEYCIRAANLDHLLSQADLIITGEGRIDNQSFCGKIPGVIAAHARHYHVGVLGVAGSATETIGIFDRIYSLTDLTNGDVDEAIRHTSHYLRLLGRIIKADILKSR